MNDSEFTFTAGITVRRQVVPYLQDYFEEYGIRRFELQEKKGRFESFYTLTLYSPSDDVHNEVLNLLHSLNLHKIEVN